MMTLFIGAGAAATASGSTGQTASDSHAIGRLVIAKLQQSLSGTGRSGVSAVGPNDIWAVGEQPNGALVERWNGARWRRITIPPSASHSATIAHRRSQRSQQYRHLTFGPLARAAGSARSARSSNIGTERGWTLNPALSSIGKGIGYLTGVSASSSSNIWAVGTFEPRGNPCADSFSTQKMPVTRPLVLHWNGTAWSRVSVPVLASRSTLYSALALSPRNVWAVGHQQFGNRSRTLIEHWNRRRWRVVASPHPGQSRSGILWGISGMGSKDIWAVGYYSSSGTRQRTLIEYWNGSSWRICSSPNHGTCHLNPLQSVAVSSKNSGWAVGSASYCGHPKSQAFAAHWNGTKWSPVPAANGGSETFLTGVVAEGSTAVWAVGTTEGSGGRIQQGVIEHYRAR